MPTATRISELMAIGTSGNQKPARATAAPPTTAVSAAAPPGGCSERVSDMMRMASGGLVTSVATVTPTKAEIVLPPTIDQGWASGLAGTAKSSTAEAPMGATISGRFGSCPMKSAQTRLVRQMPISAPTQPINRSFSVAPARIGAKNLNLDEVPGFWASCGGVATMILIAEADD
jgi:hypothetical protein